MKKLILCLFAFLALNANAQVPTNGLSVFYNFNGNLTDDSNNGFDASSNGSLSYTPGSVDSLVHLNGVNSEIYYDYSGNESFFENQNFSCVARVQLDTLSLYNNILEIGNPASTTIYFRVFRQSSSHGVLQVGHYSTSTNSGNEAGYFPPFSITDTLLNLGFSSSYDVVANVRTTKIFINDSLVKSVVFTSDGGINFSQVENILNIGYRYNSTGLKLRGDIDFLMFYNRALDSTEMIQALAYNSTLGLKTISENEMNIYPNPTNGLVNLLNIPAGTVIEVSDASGRVVATQISEVNTTSFDLSNQENGVYFISFQNTVGASVTKKLILSN